jgi:nucleoside-diphosphate kinase
MQDRTLALIKPCAWKRKIVGLIYQQLETSNPLMEIKHVQMVYMSYPVAEAFYREHKGREYFEPLIDHMCSGPSLAIILEGPDVIKWWRGVMGPADPAKQQYWQIRGKFRKMGDHGYENFVHGSDSEQAFLHEASCLSFHPGQWL